MKFEKRFFFSVIPEWKDQYIALEALMKQIEAIKNAALRLVQSIANIRKLEGNTSVEVDLHSIRPDKLFWEMLDENLQKVETFYETQLSSFLEQFHVLTLQAILLNKLDEYIPFNPGQATKLERELGRLPTNKDVPIGVLGVDEQFHRPTGSSRFIGLTKNTNIDAVKQQIRALRPSGNALKRSMDQRSNGRLGRLLRSSTSANLDQKGDMDNMSIEDHVRDYQFASAQLEASQLRHREELEFNPHGGMHPGQNYHGSNVQGQHPPRGGISRGHSRLSSTNPVPPSHLAHHSEDSMRRLLETDSESDLSAWRRQLPEETPAHQRGTQLRPNLPPLSLPATHSEPFLHGLPGTQPSQMSSEMPTPHKDVDWCKDDFFQSSDSDQLSRSASVTSFNSQPQNGTVSQRGLDSTGLDGRAPIIPPVRLTKAVTEPSHLTPYDHSAPGSARRPSGPPSGYSSFFGSEDERSDDDDPGLGAELSAPIRVLHDSLDSDGGDHASSDSGYASGGSGVGFADDGVNEEQEDGQRIRAPQKLADGDTETTGSRHHHVPETRLRTQSKKTAAVVDGLGDKQVLKGSSDSSGNSSNFPHHPTHANTSFPLRHAASSPSKELRTGSLVLPETRTGMISSASFSSVPERARSYSRGSVNEMEMHTMGRGKIEPGLAADPESTSILIPSPEVSLQDSAMLTGDGDDRENLSFSEDQPDAPPRTTFYQLPDPRHLNRSKAIKNLQAGFSELYRGLHLLKRYAELNVEATDKTLAKYEKNIARGYRSPFMREEMNQYTFHKATELRSLISQTEYVYAQAFTGGHRTPAMQKLRVPEEEEDMETTTLRFGLLFGLSLGFGLIILYMCIVVSSTVVQKMRPDLIVYRMLAVATLLVWYWGVDMWIWSSHRVNYPFIFEFNTRGHMRFQNIFDIASIFTVVLIGDMMLYMLSALQRYDDDFVVPGFDFFRHIPPESYPLVLVILLLGLLLFYSVKSGFWLVRTLGRIVTAPFYKVVFRDFFLADQLVSISLVLQDIDFTICYYTTVAFRGGGNSCATNHVWMTAILSVIPQLWRLLQCFRRYHDSKDVAQLQNAGKYGTGMLVAICSSMRSIVKSTPWLILWLIFAIIATVYSYGWDIYKDWSLGDRKSQNWMLRDQLLYPKWWYYAAAIANLVLRLMWTLTISPDVVASFLGLGKDGFTTVLVIVEVSRRAMWNIFRLENEQLNNCGKFRAVQDIPLPLPLKPAVEENLYQDKIK